ncbi:MAG: rod-binding protein [Armatimonadota bacterium]|nr:rod-binding protein [Armatimonadota bacterium]
MTGVPRVPLLESVGRPEDAQELVRLRKVSQEFESLLLAQMLKSMRRATEAWDTGQSFAGRSVWRELLDEHLALAVARAGGLGLARFLEQALERRAR